MKTQNRVMFVDDEDGVLMSWDRFLSSRGFEVTTAQDGHKAMEKLQQEPIDVVVSDLRMPGLDGLQLLERVQEERPDTRFILLTGYGSERVEQRARELGAFEYLNKPIGPETLARVITAAIQLGVIDDATEVAEPEVETDLEFTTAVSQLAEEALAVAGDVVKRGRIRGAAEVVAGLVGAPLMGLAFVIFLPLIGIGMVLWMCAQVLWEKVAPAGS